MRLKSSFNPLHQKWRNIEKHQNHFLRNSRETNILIPRAWWVWPSWLRRQIVALEIEGSSPFTHPSAPEKSSCISRMYVL